MGVLQAVDPKRRKVGNRPACLVGTVRFGTPLPATALAQDASQPATDEAVFHAECRSAAVLEVFKPAPQRAVNVRDDLGHAVSRGPLGLRPDRVPELLAALASRPALASPEVVAEKVKAVFAFVDQPCLGRVQRQAGLCRPLLHHGQGCGRVLFASAHHHEVVRAAHHLEPPLGHQVVERIEVDVAQQRAHNSALRRALLGRPLLLAVQNPLIEEARDQRQDAAVRHLPADQGLQAILRDRVEVALQIGINDVDVTGREQSCHPPQRVLAAPSGAEAVAVRGEVLLVDRLHHHAKRRLYHPVAYRWYPQWTHLLTSRFGNVVPSDLLRPITARPQLLAQAPQICVRILRVVFDRDMIHPGGPPVGLDLCEGRPQRRFGVKLIDQAVPFAAFDPLFEGRQHPCRPNRWFGPRPVAGKPRRPSVLSGAVSPLRHSRRCLSTAFGRHVSTFLRPFAPPALPGFIATMSALTPAWRRDLKARSAPRGGRYLKILSPLAPRRSPRFTRSIPPEPSVSNHLTAPMIALSPNPLASWASCVCAHRPGLRLCIAGSPVSTAESRLLSLPAPPSPFVGPHPASRRRSYGWLQAGVGLPDEDLHLLDRTRLRAHDAPPKAGMTSQCLMP